MLGGRIATFALAMCLALVVESAQSQRRSQQPRVPQPSTATGQQKASEEQRGTEQLPLIIQVVPSPKTEEDRDNEAAGRQRIAESGRKKEQSDTDLVKYTAQLARFTRWLFYATIILGVATIGLLVAAFVQSRDTKRSIAASEKSADAATKSLREAIHPHVTINQLDLREADESQPSPHIHFGLTNIGKGTAIVKEVTATDQAATAGGGAVLTLATNSGFVASDVNGAIIESGETIIGNYITSSVFGQPGLLQRIKSGEIVLRTIFQINSIDIFGNPYQQTFPFEFKHGQGDFVRSNLLVPKKK
jgi:low affinity Fe/Cu permease